MISQNEFEGSKKSQNMLYLQLSAFFIVAAVVVALIVIYVTQQSSDSESDSQSEVSFRLHVNPSDPARYRNC